MITDIAFDGVGCTISTASASMMTEAVLGKEISQIQELAEIFSQMVQGQEDARQKELGDASFSQASPNSHNASSVLHFHGMP